MLKLVMTLSEVDGYYFQVIEQQPCWRRRRRHLSHQKAMLLPVVMMAGRLEFFDQHSSGRGRDRRHLRYFLGW